MYLIKGDKSVDDRGVVDFVNDFDFQGVKRFYVVSNHSVGYIRAWHGHKQEAKYVYCVSGSIYLGVVNLDNQDIETYVLSSDKPQVVYIPPNSANGFKTLTPDAKVIFFSTTKLNKYPDDDIRFPYDKWDIWEITNR